ncbi:MAG: tRNA (adenosine(37)-N6)-threonylcarbamoyltransferase complex ATPase subunit type 1 TsaE [Bacteroidales bacterium]|nr:tRNA (adenosine(37)-N6)-threonylcarbamoyltransferase complex ATPase subunit type 1 TsaE [Bacteroidales bacterium]
MRHTIHINNLESIRQGAQTFLSEIGSNKLICLDGVMGAGKTTFTCALCDCLGVKDPVCSPTFTIVNEYKAASGENIYHFDFYRINRLEEALDIGLYDYLDSGCLCIMEWSERVEALLPEECVHVNIVVNEDQSRTLEFDL